MKSLAASLAALLLLPFGTWAMDAPAPAAKPRVYVGLVADEVAGEKAALLVRAVAPGSPAAEAGICAGDIVLAVAGKAVHTRREMGEAVKGRAAGELVPVDIRRGDKRLTVQVRLKLKPAGAGRVQRMDEAVGADRPAHSIAVPEEIRREIRRTRGRILEQLAAMPEGMQASRVTDELQTLRDLARDANAGRAGWMSGRAGDISIRFKDEEGSIELRGANNLLELVLLDRQGTELARYPITSSEEQRAVPETVLQRLRKMR